MTQNNLEMRFECSGSGRADGASWEAFVACRAALLDGRANVSSELGHGAEQSRQHVIEARRAGERDGATEEAVAAYAQRFWRGRPTRSRWTSP